jgi:transcription termination/antitermination protein NusG
MSEEENKKRWYVIHAYSNQEHRVVEQLKEQIKLHGYEDYFGEIRVPTEDVVEIRDGKKRKTERKFFPGYVLIEMEMNDETFSMVRHSPRVLGFIGGNKADSRPAPLTDREVSRIIQQVEDSETAPRPKVLYVIGEELRIIEGPFVDFTGAISEVNYEKSSVKLNVSIFGRSTPVELNFDQVEKLS